MTFTAAALAAEERASERSGVTCASRFVCRGQRGRTAGGGFDAAGVGKTPPSGWRVGRRCCGRERADRESPKATRLASPSLGRRPLSRLRIDPAEGLGYPQASPRARHRENHRSGGAACIFCGVDSFTSAAAIVGSQIRNNGAGARRFEHHLVGTPSDVREPRQDENVVVIERGDSRPVIGDQGLDDDLILTGSRTYQLVTPQARGWPIA